MAATVPSKKIGAAGQRYSSYLARPARQNLKKKRKTRINIRLRPIKYNGKMGKKYRKNWVT